MRRNFDESYLPALRASAGCTTLACWQERLTAEGTSAPVRERAIYQVALLARGEAEPARSRAREALFTALESGLEGESFTAAIFALDRLSPEGCDQGCRDRLVTFLDDRRGETTFSGRLRSVRGLLGRLRYRSGHAGSR